jgi:hypothetical protein
VDQNQVKDAAAGAKAHRTKTAAVAEVVAGLGLDPIKQMGQIAMDERIDVSVRVQVLKELCQYVAPEAQGDGSDKRGRWSG